MVAVVVNGDLAIFRPELESRGPPTRYSASRRHVQAPDGGRPRLESGSYDEKRAAGYARDGAHAGGLLREIRGGDGLASRLDPALPVLILSGLAGEWVPLRAFDAGCDDFLA